MLRKLEVKNIILLKHVEIDFSHGLTVLTGETGAGKSILLDALGLVLGKRFEAKMLRSGEEVGHVIAEFDISHNAPLKSWLAERDIETEDNLIIRRQIKSDGTSKTYVNDVSVTQKLLKNLGEWLIIIHGQHDSHNLTDNNIHMQMLDSYGGLEGDLKEAVVQHYKNWKKVQQQLDAMNEEIAAARRETEYLTHVVAELSKLKPQIGEEEELADARIKLQQAEKVGSMLQECETLLSGGANPLAEQLRRVQTIMMRSNLTENPNANKAIDYLENCLNELAEAEIAINELAREIDYDEAKLDKISERLFSLREVARKYHISPDALPNYYQECQMRLNKTINCEAEIAKLTAELAKHQQQYLSEARKLRQLRLQAGAPLCESIHKHLSDLKMNSTKVRVRCDELADANWRSSGIDDVSFEVATNAGSHFGSLGNIASGGELSRFMLAMAVVMNKDTNPPMLIFDEIDTGTGGAVADAIGLKLAELSKHQQVVVVTHLPQVAARADTHLFISKETVADETITQVQHLDKTDSKEELARMLSGAVISDAARFAAETLIANVS
jgi:DNA repair protein RecN (Recombination protein N)